MDKTQTKKDVPVKSERNPPSFWDLAPPQDRLFDSMVDRFFGNRFLSGMDWPETSRNMMAHVQETEKQYILTAELPGIPKEDIKINVHGNILTIRAEHKSEQGAKESQQGYKRQHRAFMQSFSLPSTIDADKIEATSELGVLEIVLPKTEKALPKQIEVKGSKMLGDKPSTPSH